MILYNNPINLSNLKKLQFLQKTSIKIIINIKLHQLIQIRIYWQIQKMPKDMMNQINNTKILLNQLN